MVADEAVSEEPFVEPEEGGEPEEGEGERFTAEEYISAATQEHAGLAAAVAESATEAQMQAVAAPMPGLESGVVGFEDVVEEGLPLEDEAARKERRRDLAFRVVTGLVLVALFAGALWWGTAAVAVLAIVVVLLALSEFYAVLLRQSRQPLAVFGLLGGLAMLLGTRAWGVVAIPGALALTAIVILFYYALEPERSDPLGNTGWTLTGMVWISGFAAFVLAMLDSPDFRVLIFAVVALTEFMDTASYFAGRSWGRHKLAPALSPSKTVEGLIGGVVVVLLTGAILGLLQEPFDLGSGLLLAAVVAVAAPVGDLAVSVFKRTMGVKDTGVILPGHGGMLDRIDSLLYAIPAAWVVFRWLGFLA